MLDLRECHLDDDVSTGNGETKWEPLRAAIDRGGWLDVAQAIGIAVALIDSLDRLEASDIRPETILIGTSSNLGVSVCLRPTGLHPDVRYLSPEAVAGSPVDERGEVYAVGATLYEMLTDRPPFDADTPEEVSRKRMFHSPIPPALLRPEVPEGVSRVVGRMLAGKPDQRYASLAEARQDLATLLRDLTAPPRPMSQPEGGEARWSSPETGPVTPAPTIPTFRTARELVRTPVDWNVRLAQTASVVLLADLLAVVSGGVPLEVGGIAAVPMAVTAVWGLWRVRAGTVRETVAATVEEPASTPPPLLFKTEPEILKAAVHRVMPTYQPRGTERSVSGSVSIRVTVGEQGLVTGATPLTGSAELIPPSLAALREWRFRPDVVEGRPVGFFGKVTFHFGRSG